MTSPPRWSVNKIKHAIEKFIGGTVVLEEYAPASGLLTIRLQKGINLLFVTLYDCYDFNGKTEFVLENVALKLEDDDLKLLDFGDNIFYARFNRLALQE